MSISSSSIASFERVGYLIVHDVLGEILIEKIREELERAIQQDKINRPKVFDAGMVHNCMFRGTEMARLLNHPILNRYAKALLSPFCIVYAYQSSSLFPHQGNYGSRIHVDCPRHIPGYMTNLGVIFPLDDFTEENGATYGLPGSHLYEDLPAEEKFYDRAKRLTARRGDMILFNGRLVHAAGQNRTNRVRHSLTMNICRPFMRQRFDFARMAGPEVLELLNDDGMRMLGMNVRVPTCLDEFYLPFSERLYKPNQE